MLERAPMVATTTLESSWDKNLATESVYPRAVAGPSPASPIHASPLTRAAASFTIKALPTSTLVKPAMVQAAVDTSAPRLDLSQ
mmetsp:Transcript_9496/g.15712  ORF Transcript_9496/g.15712 Transcript_9496/m.15712 type:complete len:84 (+) Transcript_9496:1243-1494(+)